MSLSACWIKNIFLTSRTTRCHTPIMSSSSIYFLSGSSGKGNPVTFQVKTSSLKRAKDLVSLAAENTYQQELSECEWRDKIEKAQELRKELREAMIPMVFKVGNFCESPWRVLEDGDFLEEVHVTSFPTQGDDEFVVYFSCLDG